MNNEFVISPKWQKKINLAKRAGLQRELYPDLIVYFIRQRYSQDDEFALNRQRDVKEAEWNDYNNYCENAKAYAKELLGL